MSDKCGLSRFKECNVLNLDEIGITEKHADLLLVCSRIVIVIEETRVMKSSDIDQVEQTLYNIKNNKEKYGIDSDPSRLIGIIHSTKRFDSIAIKVLATKSRRGLVLDKAECCESLIRKIQLILSKTGEK